MSSFVDGSRPPAQPCQQTSCFAEADVSVRFSRFFFPSESVSILCADLVCPPCFADHGGTNSAAEAALMFNSSLFVLIHGNPGFPLGISPREADLVFAALSRCIKALQQHAGGCRRYLPNIAGVNSHSAKTHRSCHCLIIQMWCIYSFSTKESRPPCIMDHPVLGTSAGWMLFKQVFWLHAPVWFSWLICGKNSSDS